MTAEEETPLDRILVPRPDRGEAWRIARRLRRGAEDGRPGLVWLGGYASDMQGNKALAIDAWARRHGRSCLRFDYSGHGDSDGAFADGCIGDWLEQSLALFEASTRGPQIVLGSSMGAWIALLMARRLAEKGAADRLAGFVLIAPAVDFTERLVWPSLGPAVQAEIMEKGMWRRPTPDGGEGMPFTRRLFEDGRRHLMYDGPIRAYAPVEILQGSDDDAVPWRHALALVEHLVEDPVTFSLVPGGDHRLSRDEDLQRLEAAVQRIDDICAR